MDYKIIWSDSALADPDSICSYIARRDPDAAERVGLAIFDQVGTLARFPFKGHPYRRGASGNFAKLRALLTAFSMTWTSHGNESRFFTFGTVRGATRNCKIRSKGYSRLLGSESENLFIG